MTEYTTEQRLYDTCKSIADELHAVAEGRLFRDSNGVEFEADDKDAAEEVDECAERVDMYDYLDDPLDIKATIGTDGRIFSVRVAVCLGGPNIYVDTDDMAVVGYWGNDSSRAYINRSVADEVEDAIGYAFSGVTVSTW